MQLAKQSQTNPETPLKPKKFWMVNLFLLGCFVIVVLIIKFGPLFLAKLPPQISSSLPKIFDKKPSIKVKSEIAKFKSEQEFRDYLERAKDQLEAGFGVSMGMGRGEIALDMAMPTLQGPEAGLMEKSAVPERVSETNVQVKGIDEPDIVKTDGEQIYFSSNFPIFRGRPEPMPLIEEERTGETKIIKAFPPADLEKTSTIEKTGNLLLDNDVLIIFSGQDIYGYDVSDPENPSEKWKVEFSKQNHLVDARLYKNKVYLITKTQINHVRPCPIPLLEGNREISVRCVDIYHPVVQVPIDVTFTAMVLDSQSGQVDKNISFVGASGSSVVYMSENALFITYTYSEDMIEFFYKFFKEEAGGLVPDSVIQKLEKLKNYDISGRAKWTELQTILEEYKASLDDDERMKMENEFTNRMQDFAKKHARSLEKTGIVKIDLSKMEVSITGGVPGRPLNQFSLDEYKKYLRIATTTGDRWMFGVRPSESVNDVYILDKDLKTVGSILDLGLGERIYSARFIEDKGYVVTFKQIDPFYVLDLSDPKNPQKKGELKIPGYSSYLHPIDKDKILGAGRENRRVKISLFDVSDAAKPIEVDKYMLDEYWSEIENTHHAFLLDKKHKVFFLPGSKGGYVFSYEGNALQLTKAVSDIQAQRAIYLDDYMYIIGRDKLIILNENDWQKVNEMEF